MNDTSNLSYPGSRRIYVPGRLYPDVRVPMREILLSDTLLPDGSSHPNDPVLRVRLLRPLGGRCV